MRRFASLVVAITVVPGLPLPGQARTLPNSVSRYVSVNAPVVAITHVRLIDGTGTAARNDQTIIIRGETISEVGSAERVTIPAGAQVIDGTGKSVIPGLIGLHDHMYYGGMRFMGTSYPRLFLSAGVTTVRTTGSVDAYQELYLKGLTDSMQLAGPTIVPTGPYLQGMKGGFATMHPLTSVEDARRMVQYWAEEGVTWFKAYTWVSRAELGAAITEAHKHGIKVTAHLCSVGFREAVALGIDQLEHGLLTNTEYIPGKVPDECPPGNKDSLYASLDVNSAAVQQTFKEMVARGVAMTSTLDVFELSSPSRVPVDQRVLDALYPDAAALVQAQYDRGKTVNDSMARRAFKKSMEFERAFVKAGGLLGAGSDPCCGSAIAGYGDQRNFELLVEAGFTPEQAIQIMTSNGAKILGFDKTVGTIKAGMQADLVLLAGDPVRTASDIKNVEIVFRKGLGFDPVKLKDSVKGMVGVR